MTTIITIAIGRRRSARNLSFTCLHFALTLTLLVLSSQSDPYTSAQLTPNYPTPSPASGAAVARTKTNLFILGGSVSLTPNNSPTNQFITLDLTIPWPANRPAWTILNPGPANSIYPATFTADQKRMLVFHLPGTNAVYEFRVDTGAWNQSTMSFASMKWQGVGAITDPRTGLIYLAAGYTDDTRTSIDTYDPVQQTVQLSKLPDKTANQTAGQTRFGTRWFYGNVWCESRKSVLYYGGYDSFGKLNLDENVVTELAVDTMVWSTMKTSGPTPPMRADHCMAANEDGSRVVVYGGRVNNLPNGEVFVLETATGVWTKGTPGDPRMYVACTITGNLLLIWGGTNAAIAIPTSDMLIYNYISGTWLTSYTPPALYQGLVPPIIPVTGPGSTRPQPSSPALSSTRSTPGSTIGGDHGSAAQPPSNTAAIVGGTVGGLALIAAIAAFFVYRKTSHKYSQPTKKDTFLLVSRTTTPYDDDDGEQDNAKKFATSFEPLNAKVTKDSRNNSLNSNGSGQEFGQRHDASAQASKQDPQLIVPRAETALDRSMRDLELQQQQLDLRWQLLMLQQQEQQLRTPLEQQHHRQMQQQQLQQLQLQQQHLQGQQWTPHYGVATVVGANTTSNALANAGRFSNNGVDYSSNQTAHTVHTVPDSRSDSRTGRDTGSRVGGVGVGSGVRSQWQFDYDQKRVPNNPHTSIS